MLSKMGSCAVTRRGTVRCTAACINSPRALPHSWSYVSEDWSSAEDVRSRSEPKKRINSVPDAEDSDDCIELYVEHVRNESMTLKEEVNDHLMRDPLRAVRITQGHNLVQTIGALMSAGVEER